MLRKFLYHKNIECGYLYFYIHFIVEIICFYFLSTIFNNILIIWIIPFLYDAFAFVPQSLIGYISDKFPKINIGIIGIILLILAILLKQTDINIFIPLLILCMGNAIMHISGAEITLKSSNGCLSHSAIFVAGGSFGVITGKILGSMNISFVWIILLALTMIPFHLLAGLYDDNNQNEVCESFNYANDRINPFIVIILAVLVVIIRGYIGYGIPTSWNKNIVESIIFYFTMGLGKALGGILSDAIGFKKVAFISTVISIPFLCFGDSIMIISLIGIMCFSMTMSLTLGLLVSVLKKTPGLAFGLTTIGLFLGTVPIFFIKIINPLYNIILIIISSCLCALILLKISSKGVKS